MGDRQQAPKQSRCINSHPGQLSLAIPSRVGAMSNSDSWGVNTARCTSSVSVVWQCKLVSGWGVRKRRSSFMDPRGLYVFLHVSLQWLEISTRYNRLHYVTHRLALCLFAGTTWFKGVSQWTERSLRPLRARTEKVKRFPSIFKI